jgi:hypothetical protein
MDSKKPPGETMSAMFDLEQSIADWRRRMLAVGIKTPVPLEELESHLREEIQQQLKLGLDEDQAFEISVQKIGRPELLGNEFQKSERTFMKMTIKISAGILGTLSGAALMVPGSIQLHNELAVANGKLGLWLLGLVLLAWSFELFRKIIRGQASSKTSEKIPLTLPKQILKTSAGVVVLMIGLGLVMPAVAQARDLGMMKFDEVGFLVFGIALLIAGGLVTFFPYTKRRA